MIFNLEHTLIIASVFLLNNKLCNCACARAEYEINGECCPMCPPGSRVYRHCTEYISTTCVPCFDSTFTSEINGLLKCLSCATCDSGLGLRVKTVCTHTSDTVCEPLDGFYCTIKDKGNCAQAVEHTKCSPGQYIMQKGTSHEDSQCAGCKNGTYSDGSAEICKQQTKCKELGLMEIKPGTEMSDVECGNTQVFHIAAIIVGFVFLVSMAITLFVILKRMCRFHRMRVRNAETKIGLASKDLEEIQNIQTSFLPLNNVYMESSYVQFHQPEQKT